MLENQQVDICIIGAGLTGLLLAYRLEKTDKKVVIVESRITFSTLLHYSAILPNAYISCGVQFYLNDQTSLIRL
jgi:ribulose 1,5-bisphosphate synthetase/thiazole synthase